MKNGEIAFEWFERGDYPNIRELMEDKHRLPASFDGWEKNAIAGELALAASRHTAVRTMIVSHAFASWCRERGVKPDARSRLRYCNERHEQTPDPRAPSAETSRADHAFSARSKTRAIAMIWRHVRSLVSGRR